MVELSFACPGGEIGRRTGLKILSFLYRGVPVQVRPGAPFLSLLLQTVLALFFLLYFDFSGFDGGFLPLS